MPFQTQVNQAWAPGLPGDFSSANPRWNVEAGPGALVAGPNGLQPGLFAWVDPNLTTATNYGSGPVAGFVHRSFGEALITNFLAEVQNVIPAGYPVTVFNGGEFWALNSGTTEALPTMKAYANYATGAVTFGPTGNPPQGASVTGSIAPATAGFTGSISGSTLTVTAVASGVLVVGETIAGTGVITGTMIVAQLTGTTGGVGTYTVSAPQTVASEAMTGAYGVLTVTATGSGALATGDILAGTAVTAGTYITSLGVTAGTYNVSASQTVASETITAAGGIETKWVCQSIGAPGEVVKISSHVYG